MNRRQIRQICRERLATWSQVAAANHSTPAVLVCVGHDSQRGRLHICVPEELDRKRCVLLLEQAICLLRDPNACTQVSYPEEGLR